MDESKLAAGSEVQVEDASGNDAPIEMLDAKKEARSKIASFLLGIDESKLAITPVGGEAQVEDAFGIHAPIGMLSRSGIGGIDESKAAIKPAGSEVQVEDASGNASNDDAPNEMLEVDAAEEARFGSGVTAPHLFIGGVGGTQHHVRGWTNGRVITRIRVFSGNRTIKAYTIWFSDFTEVTYGSPERTNFAEYTFEDGERLTSLTLWGNGVGTRAGWIEFTTTRGLTFSYGMHGANRQTPYGLWNSCGLPFQLSLVSVKYRTVLCLGLHIFACLHDVPQALQQRVAIDDLNDFSSCPRHRHICAWFYLLNAIEHAELTNVTYPTLSFDTVGIIPKLMDRFDYMNNASTSRDWDFTRTVSEATEETWAITVGVTVHATLTVSAGIPLVANVSGQFGWQVGATGHYEKTQTSAQQFSWSLRGTVEPGHSVDIKAITRMGTTNTQYQGTMVVRLRNGFIFSYPTTGRYRGISYTSVQIMDDSTR